VAKQANAQHDRKIAHTGENQAEADYVEGRKRRGCSTPLVSGQHSQHGGSTCSGNRCVGRNQGGRCNKQSDADHQRCIKSPKAMDYGLLLKD
jgi:hypothetical protein